MTPIINDFTRLLGIQVPVVCAPMANVGGAALAAQATLGGGFGFIGAGYYPANKVRDELETARSILSTAGRMRGGGKLPVGIAFFGWKFDQNPAAASEMLDIALEAQVQAIWLSFGTNLRPWVDYVRSKDRVDTHKEKTLLFTLVNSVDEAVAAKGWPLDVIVAQGIEGGGHGGNYAPPTFSLVSSILPLLSPGDPLLLAAGGLANGAQAAALLALGVAGAVFGTRFLLTPESTYTAAQKAALLAAGASATVRTEAFDHARGTLGWPDGVDGRGLRNALVADYEAGLDAAALRARFAAHASSGDPDYAVVWAGTGVGEMHEIKGAQDIVRQLHQEMLQRLRAVRQLLDDSGDGITKSSM
ncbi:hypothetical protein PHLGIDRAFT_149997 [Phlebiopsis gigantea 11061_1 CR5-6]|uniref:Uncharacterized protein n=1 Tax=Phlebiopsis gigantea (strain 11061_1 CR5-6) TaxID=745531 RepID=A0A0C3NKH5_PHLG1|nr:hypothetical protein PHLGIDRAFT_149997 [Phlebiopsis gigantea 11061_1 CR5-6]